MKRAVKKKKSAQILPWLLMMAAAVALGLYMPGFFTRIQNNRTDNTRETVDLGSSMLSITSDSAKLEKLGLFSLSSENNNYNSVSISGGQNMTKAEATAMVYEIPRLIEGTDLPYTQLGSADLIYAEPQLIVSDDSNVTTAIVWIIYYARQDGTTYRELSYAVDDSTGIILSAGYTEYEESAYDENGTSEEKEPSYIEDSSDTVQLIAKNLTEMYKFTDTVAELDNSVSIGDNHRYSINFYTGGSRELPFGEMEVELKEGPEEAALRFAEELAAKYGLMPEKKSKFARAKALAET